MDETLDKRLGDIESCVAANDRALRGYDGKPGLVADVARIEGKVDNIHVLLSNDLDHACKSICKDIQLLKQTIEARDEQTVKWPYLRNKFFVPILASVLTALLIAWLVVRFGP